MLGLGLRLMRIFGVSVFISVLSLGWGCAKSCLIRKRLESLQKRQIFVMETFAKAMEEHRGFD